MTSTPMNDDALDEMLLQVRTDDYGDSGNYNDAKLKAAIQAHLQEAVVAELEKLLPEFEMIPMIAGWKPFPWATMKPEDQAEAKQWQTIHAHAAMYYQQFIKDHIARLQSKD